MLVRASSNHLPELQTAKAVSLRAKTKNGPNDEDARICGSMGQIALSPVNLSLSDSRLIKDPLARPWATNSPTFLKPCLGISVAPEKASQPLSQGSLHRRLWGLRKVAKAPADRGKKMKNGGHLLRRTSVSSAGLRRYLSMGDMMSYFQTLEENSNLRLTDGDSFHPRNGTLATKATAAKKGQTGRVTKGQSKVKSYRGKDDQLNGAERASHNCSWCGYDWISTMSGWPECLGASKGDIPGEQHRHGRHGDEGECSSGTSRTVEESVLGQRLAEDLNNGGVEGYNSNNQQIITWSLESSADAHEMHEVGGASRARGHQTPEDSQLIEGTMLRPHYWFKAESRASAKSMDRDLCKGAFAAYCKETSLHGWKYLAGRDMGPSGDLEASTVSSPGDKEATLKRAPILGTTRSAMVPVSKKAKASWLLFLLCSLLTALVLVYQAVGNFVQQTVSTNMDSMSMSFDNLYFPAITVCNMNFMQRSVVEKYGLQNNESLVDVFDRMVNIGSKDNFTVEELAMFQQVLNMTVSGSHRQQNGENLKLEGHQECHSMFLHYLWKNKEIPFEDGQVTMHYAQTTDASLCCQIFPGMLASENSNDLDITNLSFWSQKNPWQIIFDGYKKGIQPGKLGVQVLIDVETHDYFSVHSSGSEGVLVLIQHYRDIPLMRKESMVLSPGFEVDVGLSVTEITTTKAAISRFTPEERDCFIEDEVNLTALPQQNGYRMSMKNCLYDKALHATIEECRCRPPFYVLQAVGRDLATCSGTQLQCAYQIFDRVDDHRMHGTANVCRAPCNDQVYNSQVTFGRFPNRDMFGKREHQAAFCKVVRKLLKICHGWVDPSGVEADGVYGLYGDELKIRKNVLLRKFPRICDRLLAVLPGGDATRPVPFPPSDDCVMMREAFRTSGGDGQAALDEVHEYASKNLLWLKVYVKDSFATRILRDEKMTLTSLVANVGGLLGLCMGFSLISVAEILYFCIRRKPTCIGGR